MFTKPPILCLYCARAHWCLRDPAVPGRAGHGHQQRELPEDITEVWPHLTHLHSWNQKCPCLPFYLGQQAQEQRCSARLVYSSVCFLQYGHRRDHDGGLERVEGTLPVAPSPEPGRDRPLLETLHGTGRTLCRQIENVAAVGRITSGYYGFSPQSIFWQQL